MSKEAVPIEILKRELASIQNHKNKLEEKIARTIQRLELSLNVVIAEENKLIGNIREILNSEPENCTNGKDKVFQLSLF